ncbi:MAG: 4'-phosphopantetheinyl transferase superfamily protein [Solirubrobacteraceae bacterium]
MRRQRGQLRLARRQHGRPVAEPVDRWRARTLAVDVERVVTCPAGFASSISTPAEEAAARRTTDREIVSLWSSKEALSKALGDALNYDPRRLESPAGWPDGICGPWRAATLPLPNGYCGWVCWRARSAERDRLV